MSKSSEIISFRRIFDSTALLKKKVSEIPKSKVIVYTYGAWDLLHPGHIHFLESAKSLGDFLIVGIVTDKAIKDLKGEDRPVQSVEDRLSIISSLRCVDAAITQSDYDPSENLENIERIDILTKGDDWEYIPGQESIVSLGGKLVKISYSPDYSTSSTISKISGSPINKNKEY